MNDSQKMIKDDVLQKILLVRAKVALLNVIDIDFNVSSEFLDGVKTLSFEINKELYDCVCLLED
jgi:hypothetical protein